MKWLITADLHLTDRFIDDYRWSIWSNLCKAAKKHKVDAIALLGDITEKKDKHSASLINKIVSELTALAENWHICVLQGNHDYAINNVSTFTFLSHIPNITFIEDVVSLDDPAGGASITFIPHNIQDLLDEESDFLFMHHDFQGAKAANGAILDGMSARTKATVISGHIHVPQTVGNVTYCGAPYPVIFGDDYTSRFLVLDTVSRQVCSVDVPAIRKRVVACTASLTEFSDSTLSAGDHIKVRVRLKKAELPLWGPTCKIIQEACLANNWILHGVELDLEEGDDPIIRQKESDVEATNEEMFVKYCESRNITGQILEVGKELVRRCSSNV